MNVVEERLRDAATALGSTVQPGHIPPLRLPEPASGNPARPASRPRPTLRRWLIPLSTAVAVTVIIVSTLALVSAVSDHSAGRHRPATHQSPSPHPRPHHRRTGPGHATPRAQIRLRPRPGHYPAAWSAWAQTGGRRQDVMVVTAMAATSSVSAWAFASDNSGSGLPPVAWRLTRTGWAREPFPGRADEQVNAAGADSPSDVWAFTDRNRAWRWDGHDWSAVPGFPARNVSDAAVLGPDDVWVFGQDYPDNGEAHGTWHFDGHTWTEVPAAASLQDVSVVSSRDLWASGQTVIGHWNGTAWTRTSVAAQLPRESRHGITPYCSPEITDLYGVSATRAWALGSEGCQDTGGTADLLSYSGGSWHRIASLGRVTPEGILPDGHGGIWIQAGPELQHSGPNRDWHYTGGRLVPARLPALLPLKFWHAVTAPASTTVFAGGAYIPGGVSQSGYVLEYRP